MGAFLLFMEPSFGSGSNIIGSAAVQEALARRQQGGSSPALNQVSSAAPTSQPGMTPPSIPGGGGLPAPSPTGAPAPSAGLPEGSSEAQTIIKALSNRLSNLSKMGQ